MHKKVDTTAPSHLSAIEAISKALQGKANKESITRQLEAIFQNVPITSRYLRSEFFDCEYPEGLHEHHPYLSPITEWLVSIDEYGTGEEADFVSNVSSHLFRNFNDGDQPLFFFSRILGSSTRFQEFATLAAFAALGAFHEFVRSHQS